MTSEQPSHFKKESKGAKAGSVLSRLVPGNDGDGAIPAARNAAADEEGSGIPAVQVAPSFTTKNPPVTPIP